MSGEALVRRLVDAINRGDASGYASLFSQDAVIHDPMFPEPITGKEAIEEFTVSVLKAFPSLTWALRSVVDGGDLVAWHMEVSGVQDGPLATPNGEVPPTGRPVSVAMALFATLNADGLIAEERSYFDATGFAA